VLPDDHAEISSESKSFQVTLSETLLRVMRHCFAGMGVLMLQTIYLANVL